MSLVAALCTQCGATLQVDSAKEAAICPYCNTPYIVEKAIANYNTNITNNYAGATINVGGFDIANLLELAQFSYEAHDYKSVIEKCDKVLSVDVNNYKAWELKAKCVGWVESTLLNPKCVESLHMAKKVIELAPPEEKQEVAGSLQLEVCTQIIALINIYASMNSIGLVQYNYKLDYLVKNYVDALKLPYVENYVLDVNYNLLKGRVEKAGAAESFGQRLFYEYVKTAQVEYNKNIQYIDMLNDAYEKAKQENEKNYWNEFPQVREGLLTKLENRLVERDNEVKQIEKKITELKEESKKAKEIVDKYQRKIFGEGAKIRKEHEEKYYRINKEVSIEEDKLNSKKELYRVVSDRITFLKSL